MIRRAATLAIVLALLVQPRAAAALDWTVPGPYAPRPEDEARRRAAVTLPGDGSRVPDAIVSLLRTYPGDGFGLVQLGAWADEVDMDSTAFESLLAGGAGSLLGDLALSEADRAFTRGVYERVRSHDRTALMWFERALELRPGWSWARIYRARARLALLAPRTAWEPDLIAALQDSDAGPFALRVLLYQLEGLWTASGQARAREVFAYLRTVPWQADDARIEEAQMALERMPWTPALFVSIWRSLETEDGRLQASAAAHVASLVARSLPHPEAMRLLEREEARAGDPRPWREMRAQMLFWTMETAAAESLLRSEARPTTNGLTTLLSIGMGYRPAAETLPMARTLAKGRLRPKAVEVANQALRFCGAREEASAFEQRVLDEEPSLKMVDRLLGYFPNQPARMRALLDSLDGTGARAQDEGYLSLLANEANGGTASDQEIDALAPFATAFVLRSLEDLAWSRGDHERAAHLAARRDALEGGQVYYTSSRAMQYAARGSREALAWCDRLDRLAPGSTIAVSVRLSVLAALDERDEGAALLGAIERGPRHDPAWITTMAYQALSLQEPDRAKRLLARIDAPQRRDVQRCTASTDFALGDRESARRVLQALADEFPGDDWVHRMLAAAAGATSAPVADADRKVRFAPMDDELASVDWIQRRAVLADTFRTADHVYLTRRATYLCDRLDGYATRWRETICLTTQAAVDAFGRYSVGFVTDNGVPVVRVARVIDRDGRIVDVPPSSFLVTADTESASDVSNSRSLVIPFPNLKVGSIIDVVIETDTAPILWQRHGWSFRHFFAETSPVLENIVEIRTREAMPVNIHLGGGAPEPEIRTEGPFVYRRWTLQDRPALRVEPHVRALLHQEPWVGVSTHASWEAALESYQRTFWKNADADADLRALVTRVIAGAKTPAARLERVLAHVTGHVNYLAIELNEGRAIPTPASEVSRRGYGDCKDMVTLLIAMLDAAGIEAQPALVNSNGAWPMVEGFVDLSGIDHMIVYVPGIGGGVYVDPTTQPRCAAELSTSRGERVLTFDRHGVVTVRRVPEDDPADNGFYLTIDVYPESRRTARFEVEQRFRGGPARIMRLLQDSVAESERGALIRRALGYWCWNTVRLEDWNVSADECNRVALRATFRDTAWAESRNSVLFTLRNEVADPLIQYPDTAHRVADVWMEYPFVDTVVVRLHRVPGWHASGDIWPLRVSGEFYEGAIEGAEARDATGAWVEIHQRFTLRRRAFTAAELREFTGQWSRFQVGVNQFYAYRRVLEPAERERMLGYARANPEDAGFALQAAMQVLGDDVGGTGAEGRERRALVRDLLTPLARTGTPNTLILLYLSLIESREGHHFAADSIISRALAIEPDNAQILGFAAASRASVENFDGQLEALRRVTRATGDQMSQYNYMVHLLVAGKTAEMEQEAERLRTLYSEEEVGDLLHAVRMAAAAIRLDCAEVERLAAEAPESMLELASTMLLGVATSCGDFDQAVRGLEQQWLESPTDWSTCNELAWADALRGGDMRRAEELAQLALRMSDRNAAVLNTLGLVYLQNGDLDQARAAFRECIQLDDAPSTQRMNRYMLGLCDYAAGDHERAVLQWKSVLADHPREPCLGYVVRSLDLAAAGRDPMLALTRSDPAD